MKIKNELSKLKVLNILFTNRNLSINHHNYKLRNRLINFVVMQFIFIILSYYLELPVI